MIVRKIKNIIVVTSIVVVMLLTAGRAFAIDIIVNKTVERQSYSRYEMRSIFSLRLVRWDDGTPITVFVLPADNRVNIRFCKELLRIFPHQLQGAWDRSKYSGTGIVPIVVDDIPHMEIMVANTPGAIGYVESFKTHGKEAVITYGNNAKTSFNIADIVKVDMDGE